MLNHAYLTVQGHRFVGAHVLLDCPRTTDELGTCAAAWADASPPRTLVSDYDRAVFDVCGAFPLPSHTADVARDPYPF